MTSATVFVTGCVRRGSPRFSRRRRRALRAGEFIV